MATKNTMFPGNTILSRLVIHQSFGDVNPTTLFDLMQVAEDPDTNTDTMRLSQTGLPVHLGSGAALPYRRSTGGNVTLTQDDFGIIFQGSIGNQADLPDPITVDGQIFYIKNGTGSDSNSVTAAGGGSNIDGETTFLLPSEYDGIFVQAFGLEGYYTVIASNILYIPPAQDPAIPIWTKYHVVFTAVQTAALTNTISITTLAAAGVVHSCKVQANQAWVGTSITNVTVSIGLSGNQEILPNYDIHQTVGSTTLAIAGTCDTFNGATGVSIDATFISAGANLSALTAGGLDIWLLTSVAA